MPDHEFRFIPGPERVPPGMRFGMQISQNLPEWQALAYVRKILRTEAVVLVRGHYPLVQDRHHITDWGPLDPRGWTAFRR